MKKTENIFINISIILNALLLTLLVFEKGISVPGWLPIAGHMHPLVLHFPLALVVLISLFTLYQQVNTSTTVYPLKPWLCLTAAMTGFTALSGLFLSVEEGYDPEALYGHKWSGTALSGIILVWSLGFTFIEKRKWLQVFMSVSSFTAVLFAGHRGANITHGENFLWAPILKEKEKPPVFFEEALVYADMVKPILEGRCMNCHNDRKAKGGFIMTTETLLQKGGKTGKPWDLKENDLGLMMKRLHLPLQDKKHMPPAGKPQLTDQEIFIIAQWLVKGASFTQPVAGLPPTDTLFKLGASLFTQPQSESFTFEEADAATISKLNTANRPVYPLAHGLPALAVEFFGPSQYKPSQLQELLAIKEQVVYLNLSKMPVKDEEISAIAQFQNLRKLNLSFTDITGRAIAGLQSLPNLRQLSVSGTGLTAGDLGGLNSLKKLANVYAWRTKTRISEQKGIEKKLHPARIHWGFFADTITLQLNPPIIENDTQIISQPTQLKIKHFLPGVAIHYTLDGSEPDSLRSPVYQPGAVISRQALVKAKAFKPGWIRSNTARLFIFQQKYRPDSITALQPPDPAYKGNGAFTLYDNIKGDQNFRSGKWLGYRHNPMEVLVQFKQPSMVSGVTLSSLVDIVSYIMPPQSVEVWGGNTPGTMKLLAKIQPAQPEKEAPLYTEGFECRFSPQPVKYLRILSKPLPRLPAWHRGKGDKAWIFMDEIFVN